MLRLTKQADYGLLALRHLARRPGGTCCAREIAALYDIPPALTAKLLQRLARRGLIAAQHGARGGYQIARPATEITLGEILEALDAPASPARRPRRPRGAGAAGDGGGSPIVAVRRRIAEVLERTTLAQLDAAAENGGRRKR